MTHTQEVPIFESSFTRPPRDPNLDSRINTGVAEQELAAATRREQRLREEAHAVDMQLRTLRKRAGLTALVLAAAIPSAMAFKHAIGTPLAKRDIPTHTVILPQGEGLNNVIIDEQKRDNLASDQIGDLRDGASRLKDLNEANDNTPETSGVVIVPDDIKEIYERN